MQAPYYSPPPRQAGAIVATVLLGIWLAVLALFSQAGTWFASQILLTLGLDLPSAVWPILGVTGFILGGLPALALALIPRDPRAREAGRAWALGAGTLATGCFLRLFPSTSNAFYLLAFAACAAVGAFFLRRREVPKSGSAWWGVAIGLAVLLPFFALGALGGVSETVLAILAAIAVGFLASSILDGRFWSQYGVLAGGTIAGVSLALIGAGTGGNGAQLIAILVFAPLGYACAALRHTRWLIGIAALGPLAFWDPMEINIYLADHDIPYWALIATAIAWLIAIVLGVVFAVLPRIPGRPIALATAAFVLAGASAVYVLSGQPGFYGNQLFVVLKDQASLSGLPTTTGPARDERIAAVYHRLITHAETSQKPLREALDRLHLRYRPYYLINAIMVDGGPEVKAWLETRSDVDRVLLDQRLRPLPRPLPASTGPITTPPDRPQWNLEMVGAPALWSVGVRGHGIIVGGSDTGVDLSHPAVADGYRGGNDSWYDPWNSTSSPVDSQGHGTHTIATAVGRENVGVAPDAQWIACVNLDRDMASPSYYYDCMQFMLAPFPLGGNPFTDGKPSRAPHVLTNSWGCPPQEGCDLTVTRPATDAFAAAGIAFVAAAGNEGSRCGSIDEPPATDPATFTVAAVDETRAVTSFSSRGSSGSGKPDIAAPGEEVLSAMPGHTYAKLAGTSMATPHVAGVIALLWSANPALIGDLPKTYAALKKTASPVTAGKASGCGTAEEAGAGIADAAAALATLR